MQIGGFEFDLQTVPVATSDTIRTHLDAGQSVAVWGRAGAGKTFAVRQALTGRASPSAWVDLTVGPLQQPRFFVDLAHQVNNGGEVLEAVARGRVADAFAAIDLGLDDQPLIVDRVGALRLSGRSEWAAPEEGIWRASRGEIERWICARADRAPTIVISRQHPPTPWPAERLRHDSPSDWPIRLKRSPIGFLDWPELMDRVGGRPGAQRLALALIPLLDTDQYEQLLDDMKCHAEHPGDAIRLLIRWLSDAMPATWQATMTLMEHLDGAREPIVRRLLDERHRGALDQLIDLGLLTSENQALQVMPLARETGRHAGRADGAQPLLRRAANALCDAANALDSLDPPTADGVLRAHQIFVALGDVEQATRTARLHAGGLIELARQQSLNERFDPARQLYARVEQMLAGSTPHADDSTRRLHSYAVHYRAYNAHRAGAASAEQCLIAYGQAIELWPENALWHQRLIARYFELGRAAPAHEAVRAAYAAVPEHPRRDTFLRIYPAFSAIRGGVGGEGLRLIDPLIDRQGALDPDGASRLADLLSKWRSGVSLSLLEGSTSTLSFLDPALIRLLKVGDVWQASIDALRVRGRAARPGEAAQQLGDALAADALRLLRAATWQLDERALRRKSRIIGALDLVNSHIGMRFDTHRWLLGHLRGNQFIPNQSFINRQIPLPEHLAPTCSAGLFIARVAVERDGQPSGEVDALEPVGSGRSLDELMAELRAHAARG